MLLMNGIELNKKAGYNRYISKLIQKLKFLTTLNKYMLNWKNYDE